MVGFVVLYGLVAAVSVYVLFGFLEQTLKLLVGIALDTADGAGLVVFPPDAA